MRKLKLAIAIVICIAAGVIIGNTIHYYNGGALARDVQQMRSPKKLKLNQGEKQKRKTHPRKKTAKGHRIINRRLKPINLDDFYRNIELSPIQRTYAQKVIEIYEEYQTPLRQEFLTLRENTKRNLVDCLSETKKVKGAMSGFRKSSLEKLYQEKILPNVLPEEQNQAESIYQQYLAKSSEIKKSLKKSRQLAVKMLLSLLTREQRKIYHQEHPRKTSAKKYKNQQPQEIK